MSVRDRLLTLVKLAVSIGLLAYVFGRVGWAEFVAVLRQTDFLFLGLCFAIAPVLIFVSVLKWRVLLRAKSIDLGVGHLFSLYLIGNFFNHVLPSNVGGDAIRSWHLGRHTGDLRESVASVFLERLSGLAVLFALGVVAVAVEPGLLANRTVALALGAAAAACAIVLWLAADPRPMRLFRRLLEATPLARFAARIEKLHDAILAYRDRREVWAPVAGLSLLFYALAIVNVVLGCLAFGVEPPYRELALAVPVILMITMLPISLGGLGLAEWAYFAVFELIGLPGPLGLSVALLMRAKALAMGGIGGLFYGKSLLEGRRDDYVPAKGAAGPADLSEGTTAT